MKLGLLPETLETLLSKFNGELKVKKYRDGSLALMANGSEQSGLYFDSLWTEIFKRLTDQKIFGDPKNVLILGCGGGTQPKLLNGAFKGRNDRKITVVEIDEKVVQLAKKYFDLDKNKNLSVLVKDGFKLVRDLSRSKEKFDLIIIDIFIGDNVPKKTASREFLKNLSSIVSRNGLIIFNYSPRAKNGKDLASFENKLRQFFLISDEMLPVKLNQIIVCQPIPKELPEKNYRQGKPYEGFISTFGWTIKKINGISVLVRHLPFFPFLTLIKVARPNKLLSLPSLEKIAKDNHALMVKIDPGSGPISVDDLRHFGYKKDAWSLLSTASVVLNLTLPISEIFDHLSPQARRKIRKIETDFSADLIFKHIPRSNKHFLKSMTAFVEGWDKFSARRKIYSSKDAHMDSLVESFGNALELFLIYHRKTNELLWGLVIIRAGKTAYYLHTFTSLTGREFSTSYWGVWKALPVLKKLGLKKLDFEGIFDERFPKSRTDWVGLTQFKLDWGSPVYYPGSYVKYFNPIVKLLFSVFSNH